MKAMITTTILDIPSVVVTSAAENEKVQNIILTKITMNVER